MLERSIRVKVLLSLSFGHDITCGAIFWPAIEGAVSDFRIRSDSVILSRVCALRSSRASSWVRCITGSAEPDRQTGERFGRITTTIAADGKYRARALGEDISLDGNPELHYAGLHWCRDSNGPPPALLGRGGNDLTPALLELPISRNHQHGGWEDRVPFFQDAASPVSANRTFDIFNKNSWGRSLHFLAAWFLVGIGATYLLAGVFTGHFRRHIVPQPSELSPNLFWRDVRDHVFLRIRAATGGPHYGILQKSSYFGVVFVALPLIVISGLAMSPAITAAYPFLVRIFGGFQSARTIHFVAFAALILFLLVHVVMIIMLGYSSGRCAR